MNAVTTTSAGTGKFAGTAKFLTAGGIFLMSAILSRAPRTVTRLKTGIGRAALQQFP
jgi:hypothetical protein